MYPTNYVDMMFAERTRLPRRMRKCFQLL